LIFCFQKCQLKSIVGASLVALLFTAAISLSRRNQLLAEEYVFASVISAQSEVTCNEMRPDPQMLRVLRDEAGLSDNDEIWLEDETKTVLREVQSDVDRLGGPIWCTNAWVVYGVKGLHTIKRDPK
jgi:hypothetical protein